MKRYRQFEPVLISDFEIEKWHHPVHNHNHYELIYIKHGGGLHNINQKAVSYQAGDIFFLGPDEQHYFEIEQVTRFIFLKFTSLYLHQNNVLGTAGGQAADYLTGVHEFRLSKFELTADDKKLADHLFTFIAEAKNKLMLNGELIWMQILALSLILKRNLPHVTSGPEANKTMEFLFAYIHEHIYTPEKLRAPVIAKNFGVSAGYIGPFFKRNCGISLRNYIGQYRVRLIEERLKTGKIKLRHIVEEFGLTDESHLKKRLKK